MLRTAVIGLGGIGLGHHVPALRAHSGFELVAAADVDPQKLDQAGRQYGVDCFADEYHMMDEVRPDLVVVASPTHLHAAHAVAAMERGIDVFLEKPMASTLEEALRIRDAQLRTGRKLMVYQPHRAVKETAVVREIMHSGVLGDVFLIRRSMSCFLIRTHWQAYRKNGGGTLNNHGAHYIDLLLYLSGGKAASVSCQLQRALTTGDADDCAKVLIKTDTGMLLDIDMNMATAFSLMPWQLFGTRGTAFHMYDEDGQPVFRARYHDADTEIEVQKYHPCADLADEAQPPWRLRDFAVLPGHGIDFYDKCYEYYALDRPPFVPIEDTLHVMEVLKRCHEISGDY